VSFAGRLNYWSQFVKPQRRNPPCFTSDNARAPVGLSTLSGTRKHVLQNVRRENPCR